MGFIWTILVGLVAGLLARAIKPGNDSMGWIMTILLGIVGAMVFSLNRLVLVPMVASLGLYSQ